jgi:protein-S-isoprenylcysteine O-methyltransferase Ste14
MDDMKIGVVATVVSSLSGILITGALLFVPAGTFNYWQAWVFIAMFAVIPSIPNLYLAMRRPDVPRRRMKAGPTSETRPVQKLVSIGYFVFFAVVAVISALDHRFGWSSVPAWVVVLGQVLVAIGLFIGMLSTLQTVEAPQRVISTGLYGLVRHPMYLGRLIMMIGAPLALDSYWGLVAFVPAVAVFAIRILDEEKLLRSELPGYDYYVFRVRSRLVPYVW